MRWGIKMFVDKKTEIFNAGRELFLSKGFKDTNVSQITKLAGVGVGTFYNYYDSKEQLFFEIFMKESEKHKLHVIESLDLNADPVVVVKQLVGMNINAMNSNRILKEWNNSDLCGELEKHYRDKNIEHGDIFHSFQMDILKKWKTEGKIRADIDNEIVFEMFDILEFIDTHKDEMRIKHFPEVAFYLGEFIMRGLTDCRK